MQANGAGAYRVSGVDCVNLIDLNHNTVYVGWSMVVFYQLASDPQRNLTIFDGLDLINSTGPAVTVNLSGFLVPIAGFDAKLGAVTYEGDDSLTGDALSFNGVALTDALNPANNFFNRTRSGMGLPCRTRATCRSSPAASGTLSGMDIDVVDVTARVAQGQTSATSPRRRRQDFYLLGVFVTSISTYKPDFGGATKTVANLNSHPNGAVLPGDVIEYTVSATNQGNDGATNVVLNDVLPNGLTLRPRLDPRAERARTPARRRTRSVTTRASTSRRRERCASASAPGPTAPAAARWRSARRSASRSARRSTRR